MNLRSTFATTFGLLGLLISSALISSAHAGMEAFHAGPVFPNFGKIATVDSQFPIPAGTEFKVSFDIGAPTKPGALNRSLESAARFINMHVDAGVPLDDINIAIVIHGGAAVDVTNDTFYTANRGSFNPNTALISALTSKGVEIYLCGQTAAYASVENKDLLPGVTMARSAMTAHALLQQDGYTLNPF